MGTIKPGHRRDVIFFIFNLKKSTLETHNKKNFLGQNFSRLRRLSALQLQADILYRFDNERYYFGKKYKIFRDLFVWKNYVRKFF